MTDDKIFVGIDAGTTYVKTVIISENSVVWESIIERVSHLNTILVIGIDSIICNCIVVRVSHNFNARVIIIENIILENTGIRSERVDVNSNPSVLENRVVEN